MVYSGADWPAMRAMRGRQRQNPYRAYLRKLRAQVLMMSGMEYTRRERVYVWLMRAGRYCHQRPERSFFFRNKQFPVCARCTGILLGGLLQLILWLSGLRTPALYAALCILPLAVDGLVQHFTAYESNNPLRLLTGIVAGCGQTALYLRFLWYIAGRIFA